MCFIFENEPEEPFPGDFDTPEKFSKAHYEYCSWIVEQLRKGKNIYKNEKAVQGLKVRCIEEIGDLIIGKTYDVLSIHNDGSYRVIDKSGEDYPYPKKCFEIVQEAQP